MKGLFKRGPGVRIPPPPPVLPRKHARVSGAVTKFALFAPKTRHTLASLRGFVVSLLGASTVAPTSPHQVPYCITQLLARRAIGASFHRKRTARHRRSWPQDSALHEPPPLRWAYLGFIENLTNVYIEGILIREANGSRRRGSRPVRYGVHLQPRT